METRSKRKQQEQEAAVASAPVETRAQKAARLAGRSPTWAKPQTRDKKKEQQPKATTPCARDRRSQAQEPAAEEAKADVGDKSRAEVSRAEGKPATEVKEENKTAGIRSVGKATELTPMERQRKESRKGGHNDNVRDEDQEGLGEGAELFGRNLNNASSALQGILRKLGAGFDDILPVGGISSSRLKGILTQLRSSDEALQLDGLNQLNELLAVSMEDSLSVFPVEQLVPALVDLLQTDHNPDIMLLAARALTFLADVLPASCSSIVRHGAVPAFCERLLNIEYIDLAEQSLQALEKLSNEHAQSCLRHGALLAVLSYLDFFQTGVQRVAVATAAHMCRGLTTDNIDAINSAVPILTSLLQYQDAKVVENASLALTRIAEALAHSPKHLEALCNQGLVTNAMQLVAVSEGGSMTSQLAVPTYYGLIKLLTTCATGCPTVTETLHEAGISGTIRKLLSSTTLFSLATTSPGSVLRSSDQLNEVMSLAHALLPPLADSSTLIIEGRNSVAELIEIEGSSLGQSSDVLARRKFLADHPVLLQNYASDILPLLLNVYNGTIMQQTKSKSLATLIKAAQYCPPEMLRALLKDVAISSFIAALLASRDPGVLASAVRLSELLMLKLPDVFSAMFLKEGVVHALEQLSADAPSAPSASLEKPKPAKRSSNRLKGKGKDEKKGGSPPAEPTPISESMPPPKPASGPTLRQAAAIRAQSFISQNFGASLGGQGLETEGVKFLREICEDLGKPAAVGRLLEVLNVDGGSKVSTFEFLSSGAVQQLRTHLLGEDLKGKDRHVRHLHRLRVFSEAVAKAGASSGFITLINKLQDGLAAAENLPVVTTQVSMSSSALRFGGGSLAGHRSFTGDGSSLSMGLAALTQPFKLSLARAPHEDQLRDYSIHTVLIEPLASMAAVEEFLWPRVLKTAAENAREAAEKAAKAGQQSEASGKTRKGMRVTSPKGKGSDVGGKSDDDHFLHWESSGERLARRPASKVQPIPEAPGGLERRMTRAQANRAAREALQHAEAQRAPGHGDAIRMDTDESERGLEGTSPSDGTAEDDHMILLQGGEVEVEGQDDEDDEDDEEMPYDDDDLEEAELDGDQTMGLDRMHVHTVELGDVGNGDDPPRSEARGAAGPPSGSTSVPPISTPAAGQSYAQAAASGILPHGARRPGQNPTNLRFYARGHVLPSHYTIFQAVNEAYRIQQAAERSSERGEHAVSSNRRRLWEDTHTLHYSRIDNEPPEPANASPSKAAETDAEGDLGDLQSSPLRELLCMDLPDDFSASSQARDVLLLLKMLEALNRLNGHLTRHQDAHAGKVERKMATPPVAAREEFVNHKLAPKLAQQLKDVLAICGGNLPAWVKQLVFDCKFLFPFDLRRRYFYCTAAGLARALQHLQQQQAAEGAINSSQERDLRVSRIQRAKVRISRKRILESATKVMEMYASSRAVLELEYFNEPGTGLGPTLEFYTLLSHELQRKDLGMWRCDDAHSPSAQGPTAEEKPDEIVGIKVEAALPDEGDGNKAHAYITAPQGLFPKPLHPDKQKTADKVLERFKLLGCAMAKALQDNRLLDIPMSYVFYRAALEKPLDLYDIRGFDPALGKSLETFAAAHQAWVAGNKYTPMTVDGTPVEDLCLTFELPGHPEYELIPCGSETAVTASNMGKYIAAVVDATLSAGISAQLKAFRKGFSEVFPLDSLKCFYEDELEAMFCGQGERWTVEKLTDALKFDHGYTSTSTAIRHFLEILSNLDAADQRRFLRFVTGSPRLPPGGLSALHPRLTVVRKHASGTSEASLGSSFSSHPGSLLTASSPIRQGSLADADLPSVMTCANYLKLPPYSSKTIMQARLLYAVREGQGSFDLS